MDEFGLRYGFLTSYNMTYFLERRTSTRVKGAMVLAISDPIRWNDSSSGPPNRLHLSTREGMLGLMLMIQNGDNWQSNADGRASIAVQRDPRNHRPRWQRPDDGSTFNPQGHAGPSSGLGSGAAPSGKHQTQQQFKLIV